uniref:Uncharacterized protein n=1 Tax=Acrobeloides nanus TaxID=290746 RepID=A0A914ENM6_9BILA
MSACREKQIFLNSCEQPQLFGTFSNEMTQKEPLQKAPVATLDDFFKLGWYTLLVCLLSEFMILNQVGNMLYMMYAGVAPSVIGCGEHDLSQFNSSESCAQLEQLQQNFSLGLCLLKDPTSQTKYFGSNDWSDARLCNLWPS